MTQPLLTLPLLVGIDDAYDDHAFAALMVGLYTAAFAAMMPVTGRLVDRHGGRVILRVWLGLALAALVWTSTTLTLRAPVPVVVLSVLALGACLPPVGAVTRAGWPVLVPPAQLRAAYALDSIINEAATIAGPLLAALALTTLTAPAALMVASLAIVSGSLGLPPQVLARASHAGARRRTVTHRRRLLLICAITLCASTGVGSIVATAGLLASEARAPGLAGVLLAVVALGAVAAGAVAGRQEVSSEVLARRLAGYSGCVAGLFLVLTLALHAVGRPAGDVVGIVVLAGSYLVFGCLTGPRDALLQLSVVRDVPAAERGAAFSWLGTCGLLGFGLGSATSGLTSATLGLPFLTAGVAAVISIVLSFVLLKGPAERRGQEHRRRRLARAALEAHHRDAHEPPPRRS